MGFFSSSKNDDFEVARIQQADKDLETWRHTGRCPRCGMTSSEESRWDHVRNH